MVLRDMAGLSIPVERNQIAALQGMGRSLMPEGLLSGLSDAQLRDLFAYLRITQPLVGQDPSAPPEPVRKRTGKAGKSGN